ncbi:MAG: hypothetical protein AB2L26_02480 [Ignavibacteria bacterium]
MFLIGAYSAGCSPNNVMNQLGLNIWHRFLWQENINDPNYNQKIAPLGFTANDKMLNPLSLYNSEVVSYYQTVSRLNNNYLYLTRPKLEMLSFAQRSDYIFKMHMI